MLITVFSRKKSYAFHSEKRTSWRVELLSKHRGASRATVLVQVAAAVEQFLIGTNEKFESDEKRTSCLKM